MSDQINIRLNLLDEIEAIQDYCETANVGLNEERLEVREMIADLIIKKLANGAEQGSEQCNIGNVSKRSELLIAFAEYMDTDDPNEHQGIA